MKKQKIFVIVGPTASGKSGLAIRLAEQVDGCIINADSMQIYRDLSIISARPGLEDEARVSHYLYGYLDAWTQGTVQDWLVRVKDVLPSLKNPVLVGGTGLYASSLINGINVIPEIDPNIRKKVRQMDIEEVQSFVKECPFTDPQRMRRALEVQLSTGKPLSYFQKLPSKKIIEADFHVVFLNPPREVLYKNCETRFYQMIEQGGIAEVENLLKIKATGGVMKAIGVPEIINYLQGVISKQTMCEQAILSTRHYAKRQITWFKHQLAEKMEISSAQDFDFKNLI